MRKLVGFFGQSGCGKTTLINSFDGRFFNNHQIKVVPNVIRTLLKRNTYYFPNHIIEMIDNGEDISDSIFKYLDSQYRLQKDSYDYVNKYVESSDDNTIIITDRSPIDYMAITKGSIEYFSKKGYVFNTNSDTDLCMKVRKYDGVVQETNNLLSSYNSVVVVYPHNDNIDLSDGVRDLFLGDEWTGDNWYEKCDVVDYSKYKHIRETDLDQRKLILEQYFDEITR